jgi:hypothetical protein
MKNKLTDLNNHLFTQLERLGDDLSPEQLKQEVERSKAITGIATQIVKGAQVSLQALKLMQKGELGDNATNILGIGEAKRYELKDKS